MQYWRIKLQALHNFQIGLYKDIKLLVRSERYRILQEAIAPAEKKVRKPNSKGSQHFSRGKTKAGHTQIRETLRSNATNAERQDTMDAIAALAAVPTDLRCLRRINTPK